MSNREIIKKLQSHFDSLAQTLPEEEIAFWFARDLQEPLGYAKWENFLTTIMRAIESCKTTGCDPNDHFRGVRKMVSGWKTISTTSKANTYFTARSINSPSVIFCIS